MSAAVLILNITTSDRNAVNSHTRNISSTKIKCTAIGKSQKRKVVLAVRANGRLVLVFVSILGCKKVYCFVKMERKLASVHQQSLRKEIIAHILLPSSSSSASPYMKKDKKKLLSFRVVCTLYTMLRTII